MGQHSNRWVTFRSKNEVMMNEWALEVPTQNLLNMTTLNQEASFTIPDWATWGSTWVWSVRISQRPLPTALHLDGSGSAKSYGSSSSEQTLVIISASPLCRRSRLPMNGKTISNALAGPVRQSLDSRLTNAATRYSGRCVDVKNKSAYKQDNKNKKS